MDAARLMTARMPGRSVFLCCQKKALAQLYNCTIDQNIRLNKIHSGPVLGVCFDRATRTARKLRVLTCHNEHHDLKTFVVLKINNQ